MVCRNLCKNLYTKIIFGKSRYEGGRKYCRRCETYFSHDGVFCPCCGMVLRMTKAKINSGMREMMVNHDLGIREPYLKYSERDLLSAYVKSIDSFKINE